MPSNVVRPDSVLSYSGVNLEENQDGVKKRSKGQETFNAIIKERSNRPEAQPRSFEAILKDIEANKPVPIVDMVHILRECEADSAKMAKMKDKHWGAWFDSLGELDFEEVTCDRLIMIAQLILKLNLDATRNFPRFWPGWEVAIHDKMTFRELRLILEVYIKLDVDIPEEIVEKWCRIAESTIARPKCTTDLAYMIYCWGKLKVKPTPEFLKTWHKATIEALPQLPPTSLSKYVYGMGRLELPLNENEQQILALALNKNATKFDGSSLILALYGFALNPKIFPKPELEYFTRTWCERVTKHQHTLKGSELARVGWSLSVLDMETTPEFRKSWFDCCIAQMHTMRAGDLILCAEVVQNLQWPVPREFSSLWLTQTDAHMSDIWPAQFAQLPSYLKYMGYKPKDQESYTKHWFETAQTKMPEMQSNGLANAIGSLGEAEMDPNLHNEAFMPLWVKCAKKQATAFTPTQIAQIYDAHKSLDIPLDAELREKLGPVKRVRPPSAAAARARSAQARAENQAPAITEESPERPALISARALSAASSKSSKAAYLFGDSIPENSSSEFDSGDETPPLEKAK